jgi:hypothetical protein
VPLQVLSAREVQAACDGDHADGGGLILRVRGAHSTWVFRYTSPSGRRRDAGFGVAHRDTMAAAGESLRRARERARHAHDALAAGTDPLERKKAERQAAAEKAAAEKAARKVAYDTLARCAREYHARAIEPKMNTKYAAIWIASLEAHVLPALWHKPIAEIGPIELFEALSKVKSKLPETLRARCRLSVTVRGHRHDQRAGQAAAACAWRLGRVRAQPDRRADSRGSCSGKEAGRSVRSAAPTHRSPNCTRRQAGG